MVIIAKVAKMLGLRMCALLIIFCGTALACSAQTMYLPRLVLEPHDSKFVHAPEDHSNIATVESSNPAVATATVFAPDKVQVIAVAPGRTEVRFRALTHDYIMAVWVQKPGEISTSGYDPSERQLAEIVVPIRHTHVVAAPGAGLHRISSITSSNPGVAACTSNMGGQFTLSATSLGDTFVDFTDHPSGIIYQVHVSVVNDAGAFEHQAGGPPSPLVVRKPSEETATAGGTVDTCVCGNWRAELVTNELTRAQNAGAGILMRIMRDGRVHMDYVGMQPMADRNGQQIMWVGIAAGRIATNNGILSVTSVERSDVQAISRTGSFPLPGLGNILQSGVPYAYTCDRTTLKLTSRDWSSVFKKISNE